MPPKKKKGKGKKKGKKKDDAQLQLEDKYKRTMDEIEALKDHLATRKQLSRKANMHSTEWKKRMSDVELEMRDQQDDQKAINADMTRQYKTMQTDMGLKIHTLESELQRTTQQLRRVEAELTITVEEKKRMNFEKDREIEKLKHNIYTMEKEYERILLEALGSLGDKIDKARISWGDQSTMIQAKNKHILLEFGLNPLYI
ncbi:coiled-coil domain-containing protein 153-like [Gigantopelta aegis]|uniref:coiled-coil domain-containing protein 153-like n=1 Tax=Gigantopelta aegis TaxID=1735272 RepID=UPI001B88D376|nr:coiled-coil domain-containing protein 153-like [Gigantopelta aegis]